jgi:hypothetical protein
MRFEYRDFRNGATPEDMLKDEVTAFLRIPIGVWPNIPRCKIYKDHFGLMYIDFKPENPNVYTELLDEKTTFSKNEIEFSYGRYIVAIDPHSRAGEMMREILETP